MLRGGRATNGPAGLMIRSDGQVLISAATRVMSALSKTAASEVRFCLYGYRRRFLQAQLPIPTTVSNAFPGCYSCF
jgi:hypothetical protein